MRCYLRFLENSPNPQLFVTFWPWPTSIKKLFDKYQKSSPLITSLTKKYHDQARLGIGFYDETIKIWVSPYGNQLDFKQRYTSNTLSIYDDLQKQFGFS